MGYQFRSNHFLIISLLLATYGIVFSYLHKIPIDHSMNHIHFNKLPEEGFCAGTLVRVPDGYELIENLAIGDIVIDAFGRQTHISAIAKRLLDKCIKIRVKDISLWVGCDQQFYCPVSSSWIRTCDLVGNNEYIAVPIFVYALTTQSSTLSISSEDIPAHNAAVVFGGMPSICCGYIATINPVIAVLGGITVSLAIIAHNAYQAYVEKHKNEYACVIVPDSVILAERFYYEQRKETLEILKQELLTIKHGLQVIKGLCSSDFTYQLLSLHTYEVKDKIPPIPLSQEKKLSDQQKKILRDQRESELGLLEKQICDIQFLLVLHANQLIENVEYSQNSYDDAIGDIQEAIAIWNNNLSEPIHKKAWESYRWDLLREHLVYGLRQSCNELFIAAEYYRACKSKCIQSSTTIITMLEQFAPIAHRMEEWLLQETKLARSNSAIVEGYFAAHSISIEGFKDKVLKEFNEQQKQRNAEILQKIKVQQQQVNSGFGGGPKKDDDEEEKEDKSKDSEFQISKDDAPHMFGNRPGHLTDTPANRQLLLDLTSNQKNFLGFDNHGNEWYGKVMEDGRQLWTAVRNRVIRNGGINNIPREFHPKTGLCKPFKSFK